MRLPLWAVVALITAIALCLAQVWFNRRIRKAWSRCDACGVADFSANLYRVTPREPTRQAVTSCVRCIERGKPYAPQDVLRAESLG